MEAVDGCDTTTLQIIVAEGLSVEIADHDRLYSLSLRKSFQPHCTINHRRDLRGLNKDKFS